MDGTGKANKSTWILFSFNSFNKSLLSQIEGEQIKAVKLMLLSYCILNLWNWLPQYTLGFKFC